jgi:hypothetical protein
MIFLDMQKACNRFGRAEIGIEAAVDMLMTALNSHDLSP